MSNVIDLAHHFRVTQQINRECRGEGLTDEELGLYQAGLLDEYTRNLYGIKSEVEAMDQTGFQALWSEDGKAWARFEGGG